VTRQTLITLLRFELASLVATAVDLGFFTAAVRLGLDPIAATPLGALCGAITNFTINRQVTFRAGGGRVSRQAVRYLLVSAASLGLNTLGEALFYGVLHLHYLLARIISGAAVGLLWNYPLHRWFVFAPAAGDKPG
jgi:putative flippase GtrA